MSLEIHKNHRKGGSNHRHGSERPESEGRVIASNFTIGMKSMACQFWAILDHFSNHLSNLAL